MFALIRLKTTHNISTKCCYYFTINNLVALKHRSKYESPNGHDQQVSQTNDFDITGMCIRCVYIYDLCSKASIVSIFVKYLSYYKNSLL